MTQLHLLNIRALAVASAELNIIHDSHLMLEKALERVRTMICAEAGSIYLVEDNSLVFRFVQNDKFPVDSKNKRMLLYQERRLPLTPQSIAGFVAFNGKVVCESDVYNIADDKPYSFDKTFDKDSGYRTQSVLAVPLRNSTNEVIGVIQLLNRTETDGNVTSFSEQDTQMLELFSTFVASAYERILISTEMIIRMVNMAQLRDPLETGNHVNRVALYSVEIYRSWAKKQTPPITEVDSFVDVLRVAAMLHDIGKVAISDAILKKPGKLTDDEYEVMKTHPVAGEQLFSSQFSSLDEMSATIALEHHERWDGKGYPRGLSGSSISIEGRIVALADVFDALSSKRAYKEAWTEAAVLEEIQRVSGTQFDSAVVKAFDDAYEVIVSIQKKYQEE